MRGHSFFQGKRVSLTPVRLDSGEGAITLESLHSMPEFLIEDINSGDSHEEIRILHSGNVVQVSLFPCQADEGEVPGNGIFEFQEQFIHKIIESDDDIRILRLNPGLDAVELVMINVTGPRYLIEKTNGLAQTEKHTSQNVVVEVLNPLVIQHDTGPGISPAEELTEDHMNMA